jgi:hypothetical protein
MTGLREFQDTKTEKIRISKFTLLLCVSVVNK